MDSQHLEVSSNNKTELPHPEDEKEITFIQFCRDIYKSSLRMIDDVVKDLIQIGLEMSGLLLFSESVTTIFYLHEALSDYYLYFVNKSYILERYGSKRLKQFHRLFGPEFMPILKSYGDLDEAEAERWERSLLERFKNAGMGKTHWPIKDIIVTEIEYLLDVLEILIEPGYVPFEERSPESDETKNERIDRYIPRAVKFAVWRRDQGKCVECRSKEKLEYDHIIPVAKGGSNTERNVQLLCEKCNREKAAKIA